MSKKATPANSAAAKRAAFSSQRQQFAAKGRVKSYGPTLHEKRVARTLRDEMAQMGWSVQMINGHWIAI